MVIVPFQVGAFTFTDQQELTQKEQARVSLAIRDALLLMPREYHCDKVRPTFRDTIVPIMRFGIYFQRDLIGALFLGCGELAPRHTARAARFFVRPCPGFVVEQTSRFWKAGFFVDAMKYLLTNELRTRAGGTVQIDGLDYAKDARVIPVEFAQIHTELDALLENDAAVVFEKLDLPQGGQDLRVKRAPPPVVRRP